MADPAIFNSVTYMQLLHSKMKLTKDKYKFTTVSGVDELEGILSGFKTSKFFFAVEDSQDGMTFRGAGGGYFERRPYTVYIVGRADYGNMEQRATILAEAKKIFRNIQSKLIVDRTNIPMINLESIRFFEVPPAFATGCAGIYFIFFVEIPVNLVYNAAEWTS
jgi:hypothetical protein